MREELEPRLAYAFEYTFLYNLNVWVCARLLGGLVGGAENTSAGLAYASEHMARTHVKVPTALGVLGIGNLYSGVGFRHASPLAGMSSIARL